MEARQLGKEYTSGEVVTPVLKNLSFQIEAGEFVSIMGPSGSGKSTLMHILGFLDRPTTGEYFFEGEDTAGFDDDKLAEIRNERVGFVFQSFNLLPRTTVLDNVNLPLLYRRNKGLTKTAEQALAAVGLAHRMNYYTNQISGGEKQRAAIARALVGEPSVIFADEPTGNLDSRSGNAVMNILQQLNEQGHTIILVTHELDTARHAKRLLRLKDGRIVSDGPITDRIRAADNGELAKTK